MTREQLLDSLRRSGVGDAILSAFSTVDRERFVPESHRDQAWQDVALPLAHGSTISQPSMVATMLEELRLQPSARVLEIGSGSGYLLALMEAMGADVVGVEIDAGLAESSRAKLPESVAVVSGEASAASLTGPFDRIVISAALAEPPAWALSLLAPDGFLLAPLGVGTQELVRCYADGKREHTGKLCRFVPFVTSKS